MRKPALQLNRMALTRRMIIVSAMSMALVPLAAAPAWSAVCSQQQGAALLAQMQNGQTSCSKLSSGNLALMGEYSMGRIMGSTAAQNAMNAQMLAIHGCWRRAERLPVHGQAPRRLCLWQRPGCVRDDDGPDGDA